MVEFEVVGQKGINLVKIDSGIYPAKLKNYEIREIQTRSGETRSVIVWTFEVVAGDSTVDVEGMTSTKFSVGRKPSKAVQWVNALLGKELKAGDKINLDDLIGKECMVKIEDRKLTDGTVVSRVTDVARKVVAKKR